MKGTIIRVKDGLVVIEGDFDRAEVGDRFSVVGATGYSYASVRLVGVNGNKSGRRFVIGRVENKQTGLSDGSLVGLECECE